MRDILSLGGDQFADVLKFEEVPVFSVCERADLRQLESIVADFYVRKTSLQGYLIAITDTYEHDRIVLGYITELRIVRDVMWAREWWLKKHAENYLRYPYRRPEIWHLHDRKSSESSSDGPKAPECWHMPCVVAGTHKEGARRWPWDDVTELLDC